jgi:membrane associated rhomboid family serine protease
MLRKMADGTEVALETAVEETDARDWGTVLAAAGVPARIVRQRSGWAVLVADVDVVRARAALAAYFEDAADEDPTTGPVGDFEYGPTRAGLWMAAALLAVVPFTGFRDADRPLFLAGMASARRILHGEPWRAVTALTLHADAAHLVGNVAAMGVLGTAVCRLLGPGLGVALIVASGAAGNYLNAAVRDGEHVSVGASTSIFGALGILAGLAVMRARALRRGWVPIAAGLALLGLLGTGERADLIAHFLGFQVGIGLGLGFAVAADAPPGPRAQRWLGAATVAIVAGSWLLAVSTMSRR